jgi:hypothetical protein
MKKLIILSAIMIAVNLFSSCIILRDIPDSSYTYSESTEKSRPNRPSGSDTKNNSRPSRPGSSDSGSKSSRPNRP